MLLFIIPRNDTKAFKEFIRMEESQFEYLVEALIPMTLKVDIYMREFIIPPLRYFASGETFLLLESQFPIRNKTISRIVIDVC